MKMFLLVIFLAALCSSAMSQCTPGLAVYNKTNNPVLPLYSCNDIIDIKSLAEEPTFTYNKANSNDTYLIMLLEALPNNHDMFILHWLLSGIKPSGISLQTRMNVRELTPGYIAPVNQSQYEFRLYNMTGKSVWDPVLAAERNYFLPSQWLAKNSIFSAPLAKTLFNVKAFIPGPPGWVVPPYPVGSQPPVFQPPPVQYPPAPQPPQVGYPAQHLPNYPTQPPPYPQQPISQRPVQQLPQQPVPLPVLPVGQPQPPQYPPQRPPQPAYPTQVIPQPQYPANHHTISTNLHVQAHYTINGTVYRILTHERPSNNILNINATLYTSDTYNKRFRLTPYLIIDNKSYIWRNYTHTPGTGQSMYINGTQYVPFTPSKEIHHYHYHKGSGSALNPTILIFTFLIPSLYSIFHS